MSKCELCGEPMPIGEEMFKFHGFSGPCPKPPMSRIAQKAVIEYSLRESRDGKWYILIEIDRSKTRKLGPFKGERDAQAAYDDLLSMMRNTGAIDVAQQ